MGGTLHNSCGKERYFKQFKLPSGSVPELLSELREAFNEGEGKGKAVLMTHVLGISMEELNNRLIFEALNKA